MFGHTLPSVLFDSTMFPTLHQPSFGEMVVFPVSNDVSNRMVMY